MGRLSEAEAEVQATGGGPQEGLGTGRETRRSEAPKRRGEAPKADQAIAAVAAGSDGSARALIREATVREQTRRSTTMSHCIFPKSRRVGT